MVFGRAERANRAVHVVLSSKQEYDKDADKQYARTSYRADKFSVIWSALTNAALPELANRPGFCQRDFAVRGLEKKTKSFGETFKGKDIAPPTFTETASMPWSDCMASFHPPHHSLRQFFCVHFLHHSTGCLLQGEKKQLLFLLFQLASYLTDHAASEQSRPGSC